MENPNFYAVIPATVRYSQELSDFQKLLYAEITALTQKDWFCWASNSYFADLYWKVPETISRVINDLEKKWFIKIFIEKEKWNLRKIYIWEIGKASWKVVKVNSIDEKNNTIDKNINSYWQKNQGPIDKNVNKIIQDNNINNNKEKNIKKEKSFFNFFEELKILKNSNFDFEKFVDKNWEIIFWNENFCEELMYFYEMRKDIKAPMSARALELLCLKARNYGLEIFIKMIQQSTENSWKGIYDLKNNFSEKTENFSSSYEKQEQEMMQRFKKFKQKGVWDEK